MSKRQIPRNVPVRALLKFQERLVMDDWEFLDFSILIGKVSASAGVQAPFDLRP